MLLINHEIDLGKSFDKLKRSLKEVYDIAKEDKPGCHARALGILESRVKEHIVKCTDTGVKELQDYIENPDPDDLKNIF